jgi:hypothetical protein
MRKIFLSVCAGTILCTAAHAANITLTFNNKSGQTVTAISATPKSGGVAQGLLAAALAAAAKSTITFLAPANTCVFNLSYTLANGKVTVLTDTDLCQTDQIIIE